ncbi:transposase [Streptomyces coriariae]|uniref:transposase n=1 Tax=Streptomyces coriariae TaxID=2864460 RepID=UPI001E3E538D|nr:transposase [Streptomyces coriariae]
MLRHQHHRLRARAEDRVRTARATGLRNLPLHDTAQNRVWLEIVQIALDLRPRSSMLARNDQARLWEPCRLRLRLFSPAGQLVTTGRRRYLRLAEHWPWAHVVTSALGQLDHLPNPVRPVVFRPCEQHHASGAVELRAHPTRQSGHRPARQQPPNAKRSADYVGRPSRKIEASLLLSLTLSVR